MKRFNYLSPALIACMLAFVACGSETTPSQAEATVETTVAPAPKVDAVTGFIDPVCNMKVAEDAPITHTHEGVTYGFCGEGCKAAFVADPSAFLAALEE